VERRLDADDGVEARIRERDPDGVRVHRLGVGTREALPAGDELRARDVHRDEAPRPQHLGDQLVLRAEPVADVEHVAVAGQRLREPADEPTNGERRLGRVVAEPVPQPEVQPPLVERQEEVGPDALVHGGGRARPSPKQHGRMAQVRARDPSRHDRTVPPRRPRLTAGGEVGNAQADSTDLEEA
jgi:hypothetical protein